MEVFFVIWIALGIINYVIADRQGRSKGLGLAMGLLFGVFSIIVYLLIGESEDKKRQRIKEELNETESDD